jgi:hypothetical protein
LQIAILNSAEHIKSNYHQVSEILTGIGKTLPGLFSENIDDYGYLGFNSSH